MAEEIHVYTHKDQPDIGWKEFRAFNEPAGHFIQIEAEISQSKNTIEGLSFWRHQGGELHYCISHQEIFVLLEGRAEITNSSGAKYYVNTHEVGIVPANFSGTWKTIEPIVKVSTKLLEN